MRSRVLLVACFSLLLGACAESTGPIVSGPSENPGNAGAAVSSQTEHAATSTNVRDGLRLNLQPQPTNMQVKRKSNYAVAF